MRRRIRRQDGLAGQTAGLVEHQASEGLEGLLGVVGAVVVEMGEEGDHADEAGDGENVDRGGRLLLDIDAPLGYVVGYCEGLRDQGSVDGS